MLAAPVLMLNQLENTERLSHFAISAQVLLDNWGAVLAVTTPRALGRVVMIQLTNMAVLADLETP
jgi:hypothetical protein